MIGESKEKKELRHTHWGFGGCTTSNPTCKLSSKIFSKYSNYGRGLLGNGRIQNLELMKMATLCSHHDSACGILQAISKL